MRQAGIILKKRQAVNEWGGKSAQPPHELFPVRGGRLQGRIPVAPVQM